MLLQISFVENQKVFEVPVKFLLTEFKDLLFIFPKASNSCIIVLTSFKKREWSLSDRPRTHILCLMIHQYFHWNGELILITKSFTISCSLFSDFQPDKVFVKFCVYQYNNKLFEINFYLKEKYNVLNKKQGWGESPWPKRSLNLLYFL